MAPECGPLPSLKGSEVRALVLYMGSIGVPHRRDHKSDPWNPRQPKLSTPTPQPEFETKAAQALHREQSFIRP